MKRKRKRSTSNAAGYFTFLRHDDGLRAPTTRPDQPSLPSLLAIRQKKEEVQKCLLSHTHTHTHTQRPENQVPVNTINVYLPLIFAAILAKGTTGKIVHTKWRTSSSGPSSTPLPSHTHCFFFFFYYWWPVLLLHTSTYLCYSHVISTLVRGICDEHTTMN